MRLSPFATLVAIAALPAAVSAQPLVRVQITEVLVDPVGSNQGNQIAELENTGNVPANVSGWQIVADQTVAALPSLTLPLKQVVRVHFGQSGVDTPADFYLPGFRVLGASDSLALYRTAQVGNPADLEDFVSWGGGQGQIQEAVLAHQWPSSLVTVMLPKGEGATIAHFVDAAFGNGNTPDDWYRDTTPTLGLPNDPGKIFAYGVGCPGLTSASMGLARTESRPWIGEPWEIDLFNLPPGSGQAVVFVGANGISPLSLVSVGLPGCDLRVAIDVAVPLPYSGGSAIFAATIPNSAWLVGKPLYLQAFVSDPSAGNAAGGVMTNATLLYFGSR